MFYHFDVAEELNNLAADFIKTDLDIALSCVEIASQPGPQESMTRNRRNARRAYDVVLRYLGTTNLSRSDQDTISRKLALLKSALFMLGESF